MSRRAALIPLTAEQQERVEQNLGLVKTILSTMRLPRWVSREQFESDGRVGLILAAQRYNASRGVEFKTYASTRIRGAILDGMRGEQFISRGGKRRGERAPAFNSLSNVIVQDSREVRLGDTLEDHRSQLGEDAKQRDAVRYETRGLPAQQRRIIERVYVDDVAMRDIAVELGLCESRVSQLHSDAMRWMKERK